MAPLLHDEKTLQFDILVIQKPWYNPHNKSSFNPSGSNFYLVHKPKLDTCTCFYINKRLDLKSWEFEDKRSNLCLIKLTMQEGNSQKQVRSEKTEIVWIHNIYNPLPILYKSMDSPSTLPKIRNAL